MKYTLVENNGLILTVYSGEVSVEDGIVIESDLPAEVLISEYFVKNKVLCYKGPTPNFHYFDVSAELHVFDATAALRAIKHRLKFLIKDLIDAPLSTSKGFVDATPSAVANIRDAYLGGEPTYVFWRLSDNNNVEFDSTESYREFLQECLSKYANRKTAAFSKMWSMERILSSSSNDRIISICNKLDYTLDMLYAEITANP